MQKTNVKVGQVWIDNDRRRPKRTLRVVRVKSPHVLVENVKTGRETVVTVTRMRKFSRGYRLLRDVQK